MEEQAVLTPEGTVAEVKTPVVETPVAVTEDKTLLGGAEEVKAEETPEAKEAAADAKTVPEKYEVKIEGTEINQPMLEALTPLFKKHGLTNEAVQEFAVAYAPHIKAQVDAQQKAAIDVWNKETEEWKAESIKTLGADAPKELAFAAKVINKIGTQYKAEDGSQGNKLRDILEESRVGNHPEITRMFIALGKMISSDSFVEGSQTSTSSGGLKSIYDHADSKKLN